MPNNNNHNQHSSSQNNHPRGNQPRGNRPHGNQPHNNQPHGNQPNNNEAIPSYNQSGNLGLLYTRRYYEGLTSDMLQKQQEQQKEKERKEEIEQYFKARNDNFIGQGKKPIDSSILPPYKSVEREGYKYQEFSLTTTYPGLILGIGLNHGTGLQNETKLGMDFDHTTGLPYLPASSVKGVLRAMFRTFILENHKLTIKEVDNLVVAIFGSEHNDNNLSQGSDIFFDAFPTAAQNGLFGLDYITPHTKGEFANPTPIQFMRILPGVTFRFSFLLKDGKEWTAEKKAALFKEILSTVGIGAKTNVGYGQFE